MLAGQSNWSFAEALLGAIKHSNSSVKGIFFYDNRKGFHGWMALELSGRVLPKNQSPVEDADVFAIFDESRNSGNLPLQH